MKEYVLGLAFDTRFSNVLLIRKNRPDWQAGLLNGIGGKVEHGETDKEAMVREFVEETGVVTSAENWNHFGELAGKDFHVMLYWSSGLFIYDAKSMTDEKVEIYEVFEILISYGEGVVSNLPALVAAVLDDQIRSGEAILNLSYGM